MEDPGTKVAVPIEDGEMGELLSTSSIDTEAPSSNTLRALFFLWMEALSPWEECFLSLVESPRFFLPIGVPYLLETFRARFTPA